MIRRRATLILKPQLIAMALGAILILAGLVFQWKAMSLPPQCETCASFNASLRDLKVATNHVGLALIALGVALEIVALVGSAIWTRRAP